MSKAAIGQFKHVTIIGVGLLGGSVGLAVKALNPSVQVAGVGRRKSSLDAALKAGTIDTAHLDAAQVVSKSDLVILATPVGAFEGHLKTIAPFIRKGALVTDVGSTKAAVVRVGERILGKGGQFVGSHPMAGSENKGPSFASVDLFAGATCVITPTANTPARLIKRTEKLWNDLGMNTLQMSPAAHDRATAKVSHLPHALASLLMLLPGNSEMSVAATGFRDTTRIASGDPEMWRDIFMTNRKAILAALDRFDDALVEFRDMIELGDGEAIEKLLTKAKKRRDATVASRWHEAHYTAE